MANYGVFNLEDLTRRNSNFREVLFTVPNFQLVLMCLRPGEDIEMEIHPHNTQFFRCEQGCGTIYIGKGLTQMSRMRAS